MPRTPVQNETLKSNPYITKSISKTLLTPCRRVGLSRKRKTPASCGNSPLENQQVKTAVEETTPKYDVEVEEKETPAASTGQKSRKKTKVSKRLIEEPVASVAPEIPLERHKETVEKQVDSKSIVDDIKLKPLASEKEKKKRNLIVDSDDEDFTVNTSLKTYQKKHKEPEKIGVKEPSMISKATSSKEEKSVPDLPPKTKKIKRSLSLKKSTDEKPSNLVLKKCSVTLSPLRESNVSLNEVKELEKQVNEKQKLVDDLKQAEIYQKKHNLAELKALTARWKTGCISALNDFLLQLQQHGTMDMATLLRNLSVPESLISVSPSGDLS